MKESSAHRRRPPAEPSWREIDLARMWLARHGIAVSLPTRLLSIRIAARTSPSAWLRTFPVYAGLAIIGAVGYQSLQYLPGVRGVEMTEATTLFLLFAALQISQWRARRRRERSLDLLVPHRITGAARPIGVIDAWYTATAVTTFAGGALLALSMFVAAAGARTYAWSWVGLLTAGALCTTVVVQPGSRSGGGNCRPAITVRRKSQTRRPRATACDSPSSAAEPEPQPNRGGGSSSASTIDFSCVYMSSVSLQYSRPRPLPL
ncbi:hypothetical protein [Amycolatopsis sp. NPDC051372]|uniref:hypothetical protein n=1 Tax=Amycolatopsis sp. NPDC051372 TaxID=3155669 RepID=UPI00341C0CDA